MRYNKDLLKSWLDEDEDRLDDYSEEDISEEELALFHIRNCIETNQKIDYCKKLLARHKDALIYYTLAVLYRTYDFDPDGNLLYKKPVRYYCILAIRENRQYASAWALLSEAYQWVSLVIKKTIMAPSTSSISDKHPKFLFSKNQREQIKYIEKALFCVNKAIQIEPLNEEYQNMLKYYYQQRNEIYAAGKIE